MIYQAGTVQVSDSRVTVGGMEYPVRNISAVGVTEKKPDSCLPWVLVLVGGLLGIYSFFEYLEGWGVALTLIGTVVLVGLGIALIWSAKTQYALVFQTNAGSVAAYSTTNQQEINAIRAAINEAIDQLHQGGK